MSKERGFSYREIAERNIEATRESSPALTHLPLEYAGQGGEHVVFYMNFSPENTRDQGRTGFVLKAKIAPLEQGLARYALEQGKEAGVLRGDHKALLGQSQTAEQTREHLEEEIEDEKAFYTELKRFFPDESILEPRVIIAKVPIDPTIARELLQDDELDRYITADEIEVETIIRFQAEVAEAANRVQADSYSFGYQYVEADEDITAADYKIMNQLLLDEGSSFNDVIYSHGIHKQTASLIGRAKHEPQLKEALKDFVRRAVQFSNKTNLLLDLKGTHNVAFYKEGDEWKYTLTDVFAGSDHLSRAKDGADRLQDHNVVDPETSNALLQGVNLVRMINGLAKSLGMQDRIKFFPEGARGKPSDLSDKLLKTIRRTHGFGGELSEDSIDEDDFFSKEARRQQAFEQRKARGNNDTFTVTNIFNV